MYRILLIVALLFSTLILQTNLAIAAPGDTTTILTHHNTMLTTYHNYDTSVLFPDGITEYRKIVMEFELGKYKCDGYDPSNPGEPSSGGTGWCADWDYDIHIIAMNSMGDTIELGELITPYANSNFPAFPWSWRHTYSYDVTDFYNALKDTVTIRIFYAGWSGGFTGTVKFHFIEGARHRDVLKIVPMYSGNYQYGVSSNPINSNVKPMTITRPVGEEYANFRTLISGHGGIATENCAEFCKKWLQFRIDDSVINQRYIWRDNCGDNYLIVQSGTWIYDRANWCPGNKVEPMLQKLPATSTAGPTTISADINFQPFTATTSGASYKMNTMLIFYGNYAYESDAGIEEILSPTNKLNYSRTNPACGDATIKVKNYGTKPITKMKIEYGVVGMTPYTKDVDITIDQEEEAEINLGIVYDIAGITGSFEFYATILEVNGAADEEPLNNTMKSAFTAADVINSELIVVEVKTSGKISGYANSVNWKIYDVNTGDVVASKTYTTPTTTYKDSIQLGNGCYKLVVNTPLGYGLKFFNAFTGGWVRLYNAETGIRIPMPENDLGNSFLEGNFGNGFTNYFTINDPTSIDAPQNNFYVNVFPNPASDFLMAEINNSKHKNAHIKLINILGQTVYEDAINTDTSKRIQTDRLPSGVYQLVVNINGISKTHKITLVK